MAGLVDKRLQKILPSDDNFKQGLYMFDVGQNDLDGAFYSKAEDQVIALVPNYLSELENGIKVLTFYESIINIIDPQE